MAGEATIAGVVYERIYELAAQFAAEASNAVDGVVTAVTRGPVPLDYAPDIITMGDVEASQDPATMPRGRDETVSVTVTFSSVRTGEPDAASRDAKDAAFALTNRLGEYVRSALLGDTTLGGTVSWCFLTNIFAASLEVSQPVGFLWEVTGTFKAQYRIRG